MKKNIKKYILPENEIKKQLKLVWSNKEIDEYKWKELNIHNSKINVYMGQKENDNYKYVKQISIAPDKFGKNYFKQIYKEIYLNFSLKDKKYKYFQNSFDFSLSNDEKYIFLFFSGNTVALNDLIKVNKPILKDNDFIKWIIYQITFGLYILHSNGIIHHDIKPSNIFINNSGGIVIGDFGSAIFKDEKSFSYTLEYAAPEFLMHYSNMNDKYDMWGLGIILLELYYNKTKIFKNENTENNNKNEQLKYILTKFGVESFSGGNIKILLYLENDKFNYNNILEKISDPEAKNLIKNLLVLNPQKRFSAKEVLESKYLDEFKGLDPFNINPIKNPFDHDKDLNGEIDHGKLIKLIKNI